MLVDDKIYLGTSTKPEYLVLKYTNRRGLANRLGSALVRGILGSLKRGR